MKKTFKRVLPFFLFLRKENSEMIKIFSAPCHGLRFVRLWFLLLVYDKSKKLIIEKISGNFWLTKC